ncbi:hypothetical protein E1A91_D07G059900v1 [Gossypium mustelinum]|uniref:Uncharacterized protein n=1 Tax=Gossypium mustelinum TaxID=34275 RepID=A0A5D2U652_GOSMU|nr:hypothetical protein E1A91_D07G059900v1 [Gossypium mustelinum]
MAIYINLHELTRGQTLLGHCLMYFNCFRPVRYIVCYLITFIHFSFYPFATVAYSMPNCKGFLFIGSIFAGAPQ